MTNNKKAAGNRKKKNDKSNLRFDTPFSNDDSIIVAFILAAVLIIAVFGIYKTQTADDPSPESTVQSEISRPTQDKIPCPVVFSQEVERAAEIYGIEKERIYAVMKVESNFNPNVVSKANARGLLQIIPSTYKELCQKRGVDYRQEDLFDPAINIDFGIYYLKWLYDIFGDWDLAHMAYNGGIYNVQKWLENPEYSKDGKVFYIPFDETRRYVELVNYYYEQYKTP